MVRSSSSSLLHQFSSIRRHLHLVDSFKSFFILIPITLAIITYLSILFYIYLTSEFFFSTHHNHHHQSSIILLKPSNKFVNNSSSLLLHHPIIPSQPTNSSISSFHVSESIQSVTSLTSSSKDGEDHSSHEAKELNGLKGNSVVSEEVFHDKDMFLEDYKQMNKSFKIYVYPHSKDEPYAHAMLPVDIEPGGNYASESYFKKSLLQSHFITKDPSEADLFFLPFSITRLRYDPRVSVGGLKDFVRSYIDNISKNYPYWNRTSGTDHFYVACHSIGRTVMDKAEEVKLNAIQVVCSSSYFLSGYIAHKDASLPQIWPRQGDPPHVALTDRKKLAFFAGAINSPVRKQLLEVWRNDSEISVHFGRLPTPYSVELLGSKFCLHVKGFEVNTARIGDALYYGCVPVIIANHYDLPFADILDWKSFSLVVPSSDIPLLKEILHAVSLDEYTTLQRNVLKVRRHFQWNLLPTDYDAFYMVMYELWLRRSSMRFY